MSEDIPVSKYCGQTQESNELKNLLNDVNYQMDSFEDHCIPDMKSREEIPRKFIDCDIKNTESDNTLNNFKRLAFYTKHRTCCFNYFS